jgi:hypothetical protein
LRLPDNYSDLNIWRYWVPASTRTFRVFVSSTPEDLKAERDALQREVFPSLRRGRRFERESRPLIERLGPFSAAEK